MIPQITKGALKILGYEHLAPFLDGLLHLGQPGGVLFPKELVGQGASIVLSGLNNTMAFQSNPDWIWPMWYERQSDAASPAFVPTGMNLVTSNITHRNWTSLGVVGSDLEIMVDPVGMVTMGPGAWSLLPYLRMDGQLHVPSRMAAPQVRQQWVDLGGARVLTDYAIVPKLTWQTECEVVRWMDDELAIVVQEVENRSAKPARCSVGFSLRPYNVLSVSHIHRIKYHDHLWRVNRKAALWLMEDAHRIAIGDRKSFDPILLGEQGNDVRKLSSRSGVAAGTAEWDLELEPWARRRIVVVATLRKNLQESFPLFHRPRYEELTRARDEAMHKNGMQAMELASLHIPHRKWLAVWLALRGRLHIFDDGAHFSPGTFLYHQLWIRDSAFLALTHTQMGNHASVAPKMQRFMDLQDRHGFFCSQTGEWDSNGQAIFTMVNHVICSGDAAMLEHCYPAIKLGAQWIGKQCARSRNMNVPHRGLLPAGFSAEHFGPNDHYFWDNFWALRGLEDASWAADILGDMDSVRWMNAYASQLRANLDRAIAAGITRSNGRGLASSPYRKVDSASIGNLVAVAPLGLYSASESWVRQTLETLWEESVCQGMFFQKIVHTGLNAYLSIQLARVFLALEDSRWKSILDSVLEHASNTYTWPEAIHPRTGGGCMGDGDHGWAVAEVLSLLASLLVRVQDGVLLLGHGVPEEWYNHHAKVSATHIATRHGKVSWSVLCKDHVGILEWKIERNRFQKRVPVSFRLPVAMGISHPRLSSFSQGQMEYLLPTDEGRMEIPLKVQ